MKIYTKKGDSGKTGLLNGTRVEKHNEIVEAYGSVDELNSWIGLIRDCWNEDDKPIKAFLFNTQQCLFTIGSRVAVGPDKIVSINIPNLTKKQVIGIEQIIDSIESDLSMLTSFILPGGHQEISRIHIARTVCRRAERKCTVLNYLHEKEPFIIAYLNRLGDFLFVLARYKSSILHIEEVEWNPNNMSN